MVTPDILTPSYIHKLNVNPINIFYRFLEAYDKEGLRIWSLSTGNEPMNGNVPFFFFNCMGWSGETQGDWLANYLGPQLAASPYNDTVILALDDQRFHLPGWPQKVSKGNLKMDYIPP